MFSERRTVGGGSRSVFLSLTKYRMFGILCYGIPEKRTVAGEEELVLSLTMV